MINYLKKDITTVSLGIVAHGVNCQGRMASGVAKAIREKWPVVYDAYKTQPTGSAMLGTCQLVRVNPNESLFVANLFTQLFYGYGGGKYADTKAILDSLDRCALYACIYAIPLYIPKIGCGLGGLSWDTDVEPIVQNVADKHQLPINVCEI